jgi:hypothetical protein
MPDEDRADSESLPKTEAYTPTFDTGAHHMPEVAPPEQEPQPPARRGRWWHRRSNQPTTDVADEPTSLPVSASTAATTTEHAPAPSITVPSRYYYVKWWQFILVFVAVWVPAAGIGAGLFYWWIHDRTEHKTAVVFVVFVYVVVSTVAALMLAMVPDRPLVSALAIAMVSAVFASVVAAAPFYGATYCHQTQGRCLMGVVPY